MPIYDFSRSAESDYLPDPLPSRLIEERAPKTGRWFSQVAARLFFLLLLVVDLVWMGYALIGLCFSVVGRYATAGKVSWLQGWQGSRWISLRRSVVCGMALVIALFSPSFGMMIACTYFLMYDKKGIEEVVPSALQAQLKDLLPKEGD